VRILFSTGTVADAEDGRSRATASQRPESSDVSGCISKVVGNDLSDGPRGSIPFPSGREINDVR